MFDDVAKVYVLSLNNFRFCNCLYLIYPNELEAKNTIDTQMYASYLDLHHKNDIGVKLKTKLQRVVEHT
jgi:hypothetical protein